MSSDLIDMFGPGLPCRGNSLDFTDAGRSLRFAASHLRLNGWRWVVVAAAMLGTAVCGEEPDRAEMPYFRVDDAGVDRLPLKSVEARIEIAGTIAEIELAQTFANVGARPLEAVYVFPGSTRSAVHALEMRVGDRVVAAEIKRKAEARQIYDGAKREGKTASLLAQQRPNVFEMNLANILPGDVIEVTLRYTEWVQREGADYEYVLPLTVGPRYSETETAWAANPHLEAVEEKAIRYVIDARIRLPMRLEEALCESHAAEMQFADSKTARVSLEGDANTVGNRDFVLRYRVSGEALKSGVLVGESNGERYFMATIEPPVMEGERKRMPREFLFVVDVSGSMGGTPLEIAKKMMEALAARLDEEDRFNLMLFAGGSRVFSPQPVPASVDNLVAAFEFLFRARGGGGTRLLPALQQAYQMPRDAEFSRSIVVMTDGFVDVEEQVFDLVARRLNEANVYACGIGSSPNRHLIDGMATVGRGMPFYVAEFWQTEAVANRFSEYVSAPVLSQIEIGFQGVDVYGVEPMRQPDLLAERPVTVFGKFRGEAKGRILFSGRAGETVRRSSLEFADAIHLGGSRALEFVWARERIRRLSDYANLWPNDERREEVTQLGLKHSLLTQFTSFVAVDREIRNVESNELPKVAQATPPPSGMSQSNFIGGQAVPVTPEPEMWALMACVFVAITWVLIRRAA